MVEDKAVDLYVLERAFASTHPDSEPLFASVLTAYAKQMGKAWNSISKRLDDGERHMSLISTFRSHSRQYDFADASAAWSVEALTTR